MTNRKTTIMALLVLFALSFPSAAFALTPFPDSTSADSSEVTGTGTPAEPGIRVRVCEKMQEKITDRVNKFNENKRKHVVAYNNMQDRVKKFVEKLTAKDYDTAKLESDLQALNAKIIKFAADYATFIGKLEEAAKASCEEAGQLKEKLAEAREYLKTVHQSAKDIKEYYRTVVRPDITALLKQK